MQIRQLVKEVGLEESYVSVHVFICAHAVNRRVENSKKLNVDRKQTRDFVGSVQLGCAVSALCMFGTNLYGFLFNDYD